MSDLVPPDSHRSHPSLGSDEATPELIEKIDRYHAATKPIRDAGGNPTEIQRIFDEHTKGMDEAACRQFLRVSMTRTLESMGIRQPTIQLALRNMNLER